MIIDFGQLLLIVIAVAVLGSFGGGTWWNVRKGNAVIKWLRDGLPLIGERSTMRWIGSAAVALDIAKANHPFRSFNTIILLEPRDVFFFWAFYRARGRRDLLIMRAQLRDTPTFDMEALDPHAWSARGTTHDVQKRGWARLNLGVAQRLMVYQSGIPDSSTAQSLIHLAESAPGKLMRLSVHRAVPNLEIHYQLPDLNTTSGRNLFLKLRELADAILSRGT